MNAIQGARKEKVEAIINGFCGYYGVKSNELCEPAQGRKGILWRQKRFLVPLLYDFTDLNFEEIRITLGYKSYTMVNYNYKTIKNELSGELYGSEKTKLIYSELLKFLQL
jgi:chromosomal replication initiation ATPase DnaA